MKFTKTQLKQIIKEELKEGGYAGHYIRDEEDPDDIIASHPDPEGKNPDQVIYRWQQDEFDHREKVLKSIQALDYLKMRAREYHSDPTLNPGDIKALLQDDFMDSHYPKFFGMDEGEPSIAEFIEQFAVGQELNEVKKMKITKSQLKQIIKEELEATMTNEGALDGLMAKAADIGTKVWNNVVNMAIDIALEAEEYEHMFDEIVFKLASAAGIEVTDELKSTARQLLKNRKAQVAHSKKDWSKKAEEPEL